MISTVRVPVLPSRGVVQTNTSLPLTTRVSNGIVGVIETEYWKPGKKDSVKGTENETTAPTQVSARANGLCAVGSGGVGQLGQMPMSMPCSAG